MKLESVEAIATALESASVRYLVVGGLAVVLHGYGRATFDLDVVIQLDRDNVLAAFRALEPLGYRPRVPITAAQFAEPRLRAAWIEQKGMQVLNLFSDRFPETSVDVFVIEPFEFDREYARAHVQTLLPGATLRALHIDALIDMKRAAGRAKDLADVEELVRIRDELQRHG